jgi:hypothetical protein
MKTIKIKKNEENPESAELLAQSVIQVADGFEKLLSTPLTQKAIVTLVRAGIGESKITKGQVEMVLDALPRLKGWYIRK